MVTDVKICARFLSEKKIIQPSSIIMSSFTIFQEILYKNNKHYMPGTLRALHILTRLILLTALEGRCPAYIQEHRGAGRSDNKESS